jgi:M6 family metalloprotease-like protein
MKKKLVVILVLVVAFTVFGAATAFASPPYPGKLTVTQPSGQTISVTLHGDEWFHWYEAADGSIIVQGSDHYWRYAKYADGKLSGLSARYGLDSKPTGSLNKESFSTALKKTAPVTAKAAARSRAATQRSSDFTTVKKPENIIVILISFTDIGIKQSDAYWSSKIFGDYSSYTTKTDAHSSVNDYYKEVSGNKFCFTKAAESSDTANDSVIRVSLNFAHPSYPSGDDQRSQNQFMTDSYKVATAALQAADPYIDFAAYDADQNGILGAEELHIVMVLAGYEEAYGATSQAVWAHSSGLDTQLNLDGVRVGSDYTQQGEIQGDHPATMGVLAHELGHSLGLPDLYDYGYDSEGIGVYSLMASGSWEYNNADGCSPGSSPTHLDAWCKSILGFTTPTVSTAGNYTLKAIGTGAYNTLRVNTTNSNQYFLLENRQNSYGYDKSLSYYFTTGGIAIYHIDDSVVANWFQSGDTINDDETHKGVDMEEANEGILGYSQLDNPVGGSLYHKYNHLFRTGDPTKCNSVFSSTTDPSSLLYSGAGSSVIISVKSPGSNSMKVMVGLVVTSLTPSLASPQESYQSIRWNCVAIGDSGIKYKFDVYRGEDRVAGTSSYSAKNYFDWIPAEAGDYTVKVSLMSNTVLVPVTKTASYTAVDTTPPVITASAGGVTLTNWKCTKSNVTVTAADLGSGTVASLQFSKDKGAAAACPANGLFTGEGLYVITATDKSGNSSTFTFVIDRTAPVISAVNGSEPVANGQTVPGNVTVTVTDKNISTKVAAKNGAAIAWPADGIFSGRGVYTVTARDRAGNTTTFQFGILRNADKLTVKSAGQYVLDNGLVSGIVTVKLQDNTWTVTVNGKSPSTLVWKDDTGTFSKDGIYAVTAAASSGGESVTRYFTIDQSAPIFTAKNSAGAAIASGSLNKTSITVSVADTTSVKFAVKKNGVAVSLPSGGKFTSEGSYAITATDQLGHTSAFTFSIDLTAPVIAATSATGAKVSNNGYSRANVTVLVRDVALNTKSAKKNGAACSWPSGGVFTSQGVYTITAADKFGRVSSLSFTIDKTLPAVSGKLTNGNAISNGGYYLRPVVVTVSDTYLSSRAVTKNGTAFAWPAGSKFTASGSYKVTASDKAGNVSTLVFVIDLVKPVISVKNLSGKTISSYGTAYSGAIVTVAESNLYSKTAKVGTKTITWPTTNKFTTKGTYTITAVDKAGNTTVFKFYIK